LHVDADGDLRRKWEWIVWDDLRTDFKTHGVFALDSYLDQPTVRALSDAFKEPAPVSDSGNQTATLVKRGVIFARRNLLTYPVVRQFIASDAVQAMVDALAPGHVAVRGILFDKTGEANWTVSWHQDRSIAVLARHDTPGFGPWSTKAGVVHVQPPVDLLRLMFTLRFSLDTCGPDNGPLRAIPGTHQTLLSAGEIDVAVSQSSQTTCTTDAGGVVVMRPLLLHASSPARHASRRRVLHLEFGPPQLPGHLNWAMA
jgi:hypothetical protein